MWSPVPLSVDQLVTAAGVVATLSGPTVDIRGISQDSRSVKPGDLFVCVRGGTFDGNAFIGEAVRNGAVAVLTDASGVAVPADVCVVTVSNVREAVGFFAREIYGRPNESLTVVGVTGTNGKTSTSVILGSIFEAQGHSTRVFGTLSGEKTTPEAIDVYARLRQCVEDGITHVVMEVSSHALDQGRVNGIEFAAGVFTNLSRDHLDFHGTMENYFAAKAKLFAAGMSRQGIVNRDDTYGQLLKDVGAIPLSTFSIDDARDVHVDINHVAFKWNDLKIDVPMGGEFTLLNTLAAITTAHHLGISADAIVRGCAALRPVSGRFESVPTAFGFGVVVDYAHTPDGLKSVLESVRTMREGRTIVVFGCGGDRDGGKRPHMGAVAKECADVVVVTSDNPRNESPESIIEQILEGISDLTDVVTVVERAEAIRYAISVARRGDIVVIAGKGHETTQDIKGVKSPFSDVEQARQALETRKGDDK